jgi:hypothetical protein
MTRRGIAQTYSEPHFIPSNSQIASEMVIRATSKVVHNVLSTRTRKYYNGQENGLRCPWIISTILRF